ncbi:MAG: EAL domain-containing protein [Ilumatobacteraceae bacterium]
MGVGLVLGSRLQHEQRERTLSDSVHNAEIIAEVGIRPLLDPADLERDFRPLDIATRNRLDNALAASISSNGVVRIKIWNLQHWIVYSDNPRLVGRWFPGDGKLDAAFRGKASSAITNLNAPDELEEREFGTLLSVYVPLRVNGAGQFTSGSGRVIGAFEIYLPYQPIQDSNNHDTRQLALALGSGLLIVYLGLLRLVYGASRRLRRDREASERQANHDDLTGLLNRRGLHAALDRALLRVGDGASAMVALTLLDLDRFKEINDTLGHQFGDEVLRTVANRLATGLPDASVARLGGDEFSVMVSNTGDSNDASRLCDRIEQLLDDPIAVAGIELSVRASIGVAISSADPLNPDTPDTLLRHADVAMYVAKRTRSVRRLYTPDFDDHSSERLGLAAELRDAIAADQLSLAFQPRLDIASCRVLGVEALVRWNHPNRGIVMPSEFLPVIENTELIGPLTWHVLDLALRHCAAWRRNGVHLNIAVNLSANTVTDPNLIEKVRSALDRHELPPEYLELEITESAVLDDGPRASEALHLLRALGVRLAVDDFGTGYASINHLMSLPLDSLKIDRTYIDGLFTDARSAAIVKFTLDLARHLGLTVVAEGVEDERTLAELLRLGCNHAQGYLIARPMPADELLGWIHRWYAATATETHPTMGDTIGEGSVLTR